jgi:hypothetical protein
MSFWANVSGQMSLGKGRMGKCRVTREMNGMYYKVYGLPVFSCRVGEENFVD